ncbi:MAG: glucokinase [Acetobacteraceae bacterium]|nr:glucokinase [Acetobacteraceae bacterium]
MESSSGPVILADIGGTNARFAMLSPAGELGPPCILPGSSYPTPEKAVRAASEQLGDPPPLSAILAVAGPVRDHRCYMTNLGWTFEEGPLASALGLASVRLINDFEAVAWSLPHLDEADLRSLGGGRAEPGAPALAIGAGTGLGVSCLVPTGQAPGAAYVLSSEGGHIGLAAEDAREDALIGRLRARFGRVSAERALSGPGLVTLYEAVAETEGETAQPLTPAEVTTRGLDGSCRLARITLDLFCALFGAFAGDLALAFGARGGVFLAGGIAPRLADYLAASQFRARFEAKGRLSDYTAAIPTRLIVRPDPALAGLAALARGGSYPSG